MKIEIIRREDWDTLRPVFDAEGGRLPDPRRATAAIATDERGLAGFWTLQQAWHAGPTWVREDHRGARLWKPLNDAVTGLFSGTPAGSGYYSFSDSPRMDHIFKSLGYQDLGMKVWKREF